MQIRVPDWTRWARPSAEPPRETLLYFRDYVTVDGLTVPTHLRGYQFIDGAVGEFKNEAWTGRISFREPLIPPGCSYLLTDESSPFPVAPNFSHTFYPER